MVLEHVARGARPVVEAGAAADADVLGHRDLHGVDELRVPDRFEQRVGEAQRQQVLHRLLAEVVVDAEHVGGGEHAVHELVQGAAGGQVGAERFLDDHPTPAASPVVVGQPGAAHLREHDRERGWGDRQVEGRVAADAVRLLEIVQRGGQGVERLVVVERPGYEAGRLGDAGPRLRSPGSAGVRAGRLHREVGELAVVPVATGEPQQREAGRQQTAVAEVVHRRDDLLAGKVAGDAEDDQRARIRDTGQPAVSRVAQRVAGLDERCSELRPDHRQPSCGGVTASLPSGWPSVRRAARSRPPRTCRRPRPRAPAPRRRSPHRARRGRRAPAAPRRRCR